MDLSGAANEKLAQSFQIGSSSTVSSFEAWLKKTGTPTGNLSVTIETDAAGSPSGSAVANGTSASVAESGVGASYAWHEFTFSTPPSLSSGTPYWGVLDSTSGSSLTNYMNWGADGSAPSYADGEMKSETAVFGWVAEDKDACFAVNAPTTIYDQPLDTGSWALEESKVAIRFDDGSGSDPNIKTTFKNKHGSTLDMTGEVRLP